MTLKKIAGVSNYRRAPDQIKEVAKKAQEYHQQAAQVRRKLELAQRTNASLKKLANRKFIDMVEDMLITPTARIILKGELRNFEKKPKGRDWELDDKLFGLGVFKRSPRAYRFMYQHMNDSSS